MAWRPHCLRVRLSRNFGGTVIALPLMRRLLDAHPNLCMSISDARVGHCS
jgi:hypothetical protein